jgi:hypothetical protein
MAALVHWETRISQPWNAGHSAAGQLFVDVVAGEFIFSPASSRTLLRGGEEALGSRLTFSPVNIGQTEPNQATFVAKAAAPDTAMAGYENFESIRVLSSHVCRQIYVWIIWNCFEVEGRQRSTGRTLWGCYSPTIQLGLIDMEVLVSIFSSRVTFRDVDSVAVRY